MSGNACVITQVGKVGLLFYEGVLVAVRVTSIGYYLKDMEQLGLARDRVVEALSVWSGTMLHACGRHEFAVTVGNLLTYYSPTAEELNDGQAG